MTSESDTGKVYIETAGYKIALWPQGDKLYAFLPSACNNDGLTPDIPVEIDPSSITHMYSEHIPAVFIETESGTSEQINQDKDIREPGQISVLDADGHISFTLALDILRAEVILLTRNLTKILPDKTIGICSFLRYERL